MRKTIIEIEEVYVKDFLINRFKVAKSNSEIYVSGEIRIPLDINNLLFSLSKETVAFYSLYKEEHYLIEEFQLRGITFELRTEENINQLFSNEIIRDSLGLIFITEFEDEIEVNLFKSLLKDCGFRIFKNKLYTKENQDYPYTIVKSHTFYSIKKPLVNLETEESKTLYKNINHIANSFKSKVLIDNLMK